MATPKRVVEMAPLTGALVRVSINDNVRGPQVSVTTALGATASDVDELDGWHDIAAEDGLEDTLRSIS